MGEEILKLGVSELTTIRIIKNGIVTEMATSKINEHFGTQTDNVAALYLQLARVLKDLSAEPSGIKTEFVIPIKRQAPTQPVA
jgi:hypothetical protein